MTQKPPAAIMRCYLCGRQLLRAAAKVESENGTGYAGPRGAVRAGLKPAPMRRIGELNRKRRSPPSAQLELIA